MCSLLFKNNTTDSVLKCSQCLRKHNNFKDHISIFELTQEKYVLLDLVSFQLGDDWEDKLESFMDEEKTD